jgi:hypothetical protein
MTQAGLESLAKKIYEAGPLTRSFKPIDWEDIKPWQRVTFMAYAKVAYEYFEKKTT